MIGGSIGLDKVLLQEPLSPLSQPRYHYTSYSPKNFFARFFFMIVLPSALMVFNLKKRYYEIKNTSFCMFCFTLIFVAVRKNLRN